MKYNKGLIHNFFIIPGLFLIILQGISLLAAPSAENLSIRYGTSPKVNRYSWITISCHLKNPDEKKRDIEIRLVDDIAGPYRQNTIFSDLITIPPKSQMHYNSMAMVENSEEYNLEVFYNGKQISKTSSTLLKLASSKLKPVPIFNDAIEDNLGSFKDIPALHDSYITTFFSAGTPLNRWQLLKNAPFIIMIRPDYEKYSSAKFQAIISYVKQGGSIVFADPQGIRNAMKTPLAPLLPVIPLRILKVTKLPELQTIIPSFKSFSMPVDFLEAIPNGDGLTLLKNEEFPLIRWKKFGMGNTRAVMFPILQKCYHSKTMWGTLVTNILCEQRLLNNTAPVKLTLDEMTGFTVPGIESIRWIIFLYFFIIALPLGVGLYFRKTGFAWIAGGAAAITFAVVLLYISLSGSGVHKKDFLSFIEIVTPCGNLTSGVGYYGIMSASDKTIDIKSEHNDVAISAIPPSETKMLFMVKSTNKQPPIEIKTVNGRPGITSLNLPVNSPRHFYSTFSKENSKSNNFTLPTLNCNSPEISLQPWKIPEGFNPEAAWIQFPSGTVDLVIKDKTISMGKGSGVFHSNVLNQSIKNFISKGFKHSPPLLFLVEKTKKTSIFSLKNTIIHGKKIIAIPISQVFKSNKVTIHPEEISLTPGDTSTKLIMEGNNIKPEIYSRSDGTYLFKFQLPPCMKNIKPEQIQCNFSYINDSKNIVITPFLLGKLQEVKEKISQRKRRAKRKKRQPIYKTVQKPKILEGKKDKNGVFIFSDPEDVINADSASGLIGLKIHLKTGNIPLGAQKKTNTWRIEKFKITVKGTLPEFKEQITY
jgi:hypothetical protein